MQRMMVAGKLNMSYCAMFLFGFLVVSQSAAAARAVHKPAEAKKVDVDLYVMSKCP